MTAKGFVKDLYQLINNNRELAESNGFLISARRFSEPETNEFLVDKIDSSGAVSTFRVQVTKVRIDTNNDPDVYGPLRE